MAGRLRPVGLRDFRVCGFEPEMYCSLMVSWWVYALWWIAPTVCWEFFLCRYEAHVCYLWPHYRFVRFRVVGLSSAVWSGVC